MRNLKQWAEEHEGALTCLGMLVVVVALLWALAGCASPMVAKTETRKLYVVNSLWQVVKTVEQGSREVIGDELNEEVEAYNAETLDDFLRVYYDTVPDLANAPPVSVYVVHPTTYAVQSEAVGISRQSLIDDISLWRSEAYAQLLFIDHVPPTPVIDSPPSMYAWYALYVVDADGAIIYEDHCGWLETDVWDGQWILDGGWRDADHYRETTRRGFWNEVVSHAGWRLIERQIYTEPTP